MECNEEEMIEFLRREAAHHYMQSRWHAQDSGEMGDIKYHEGAYYACCKVLHRITGRNWEFSYKHLAVIQSELFGGL